MAGETPVAYGSFRFSCHPETNHSGETPSPFCFLIQGGQNSVITGGQFSVVIYNIPIHPRLPSRPPSLRGAQQRRGSPAINPSSNYNPWIASLRSQRRVFLRNDGCSFTKTKNTASLSIPGSHLCPRHCEEHSDAAVQRLSPNLENMESPHTPSHESRPSA